MFWCKKYEELFLQLVKNYPYLYSTNHPLHRNKTARESAVSEILSTMKAQYPEFKMNEDQLLNKWITLRKSYKNIRREKLSSLSQMSEKMARRYYSMTFLDEDFNGGEMVSPPKEEIDVDENSVREGSVSDVNPLKGLESKDVQNSFEQHEPTEHDYVIKDFDYAAQEVIVSTSNEECVEQMSVHSETLESTEEHQQSTNELDGSVISPVSTNQNTDVSASTNVAHVTSATLMSPSSSGPMSTKCSSFNNNLSLPKVAQSKINSVSTRKVIICSKDRSTLFLASLNTTGVKNVTNKPTDSAPTSSTSTTVVKNLQNNNVSCTSSHTSTSLNSTSVKNIRTSLASRTSAIVCSSDTPFESPSPKKLKTLHCMKPSVKSTLNDTIKVTSVSSSATSSSQLITKISKPFVITSVSPSSTTLSPSNSPLLCCSISARRTSALLRDALPLSDGSMQKKIKPSVAAESTLTSNAQDHFSSIGTATAASSQSKSDITITEDCIRSKPIIFSNPSSKDAFLSSNIVNTVPRAITAVTPSKNQSSIASIPSIVSSSVSTSKVHSTTPISKSRPSTHYISQINNSLRKHKHIGTNTSSANHHSVGVNTVPALQRSIGIATLECMAQHKFGSKKSPVLPGLNTLDTSVAPNVSSIQSSQKMVSCAKESSSTCREMAAAVVAEEAEPLTQEEVDFVLTELFLLLKKSLLMPNSPELRFQDSRMVEPGWFLFTCENSISLEWLLSLKLMKGPNGRTLKIIRALELPWLSKIGFSVNSHEVQTNTVLSLLQQQNKKLRVRNWKIVEKKEENKQASFIFLIDPVSENALEEYQWTVCYEFTSIKVYHLGCGY